MRQQISINGLRQCLRSFDSNGYSATRGLWKIARGGYDLQWELYYDNQPILRCIDDELELEQTPDGWRKVVEVVLSEYDWCKWYEWEYNVTYIDDSEPDLGVEEYEETFWDKDAALRFADSLREDGFSDITVTETVYDFYKNILEQNVIE